MIRQFVALLLLVLPWSAFGQSKLPPCPETGVKHNCFGAMTFPNGNKYVGEFRDDKFHGQGTYTQANGEMFVGEFRDGKPSNGRGTFTFPPHGAKYAGEFKDGKRHGQGTFTAPNGNSYLGEFKDGKVNGQGTFTFANGDKYVGEYRDGKRNGTGTYTYPSGGKYVGEYRDDKRHGQGIEYRSAGTVNRSGQWADGNLLEALALDTNRFPFNPSQVAAIPPVDPSKAERDRLTAEVEAERKKREELEARLATEAKERERQQAQTPLPQPQAAIRNERRVALLVGNGAYKQSPLTNSVNDAVDLNASLKNLGFQTLLVQNASLATMRQKTREFAELALNADVALIFFSGHGIEYRGNNYLIPTSAGSLKEFEVEDETFNVARWMDMLETQKGANKQRVNIVILDACRDNAFSRGWRNTNRGLARMDAPSGTILAYATAPGKLASDGSAGERNSPYTKNLLRAIQQPNVPVEQVFKDVRRMVVEQTKGEQVPWENSSLIGNFVFKR